jgi:hypothetical protein
MTVSKASLSKVQYTTPIADLPDAPTIVSNENVGTSRGYNNGAVNVAFTAAATGGTATTYNATSSPGDYTATSATSPILVTGLQSDTSYTFTTTATNATGTGASGPAGSSVTATTVPQAPTIGTVTRTSDSVVSVPFTAGANGGSSITGYTVVSNPSIAITTSAGTSSPVTATGSFAAGIAYTFTIAAINANGTSTASSSSNSLTPYEQYTLGIDFLVVGGGGGAVAATGAGGGGYRTSYSTSGANSAPESKVTITSATNYGVSVGAAGSPGTVGNNSQFATITSLGGGKSPTGTGGSGGGNSGLGTANQGRNGGSGPYGGGGGASAVGQNQWGNDHGGDPWPAGGAGGNGLASSITGTSVFRAGGGGSNPGQWHGAGANGQGGGSGANLGGGGYGQNYSGAEGGGSGIVVLRHDNAKISTIGAGLTATSQVIGSEKVITITAGAGNVSWS